MNLQIPTGNTVFISTYEWLFVLKDEDVDAFYQACMADDVGTYIDNPFSNRASYGKLELPDSEELDISDE